MTQQKTISRRQMVAGAAVGAGALWAVDATALTRRALARVAARTENPLPQPAASAMPAAAAIADADAHWKAGIGSQYYLDGPLGTVMMTLVAVTANASPGVRPRDVSRRAGFTLTFDTGRLAAPTDERIYTVYGRDIGRTALFLTPSALRSTALTAVFN